MRDYEIRDFVTWLQNNALTKNHQGRDKQRAWWREDGHHYRDDELPSSRHPLYANNERQHQLQMVQS